MILPILIMNNEIVDADNECCCNDGGGPRCILFFDPDDFLRKFFAFLVTICSVVSLDTFAEKRYGHQSPSAVEVVRFFDSQRMIMIIISYLIGIFGWKNGLWIV